MVVGAGSGSWRGVPHPPQEAHRGLVPDCFLCLLDFLLLLLPTPPPPTHIFLPSPISSSDGVDQVWVPCLHLPPPPTLLEGPPLSKPCLLFLQPSSHALSPLAP